MNEPSTSVASPRSPKLLYVVLFVSAETDEVPPIIPVEDAAAQNALYGLDPAVASVLRALRYVLNLPRSAQDLQEKSFQLVKAFQKLDVPHDVLLLPWPAASTVSTQLIEATLVIHHDSLSREEVIQAFPNSVLGYAAQQDLNDASCAAHWKELEALYEFKDPPRYDYAPRLEPPCTDAVIAHTARLLSVPRLDMSDGYEIALLEAHHFVEAFALMEREGVAPADVGANIESARQRTFQTFSFPLVLVAPGVPRRVRDMLIAFGACDSLPAAGTADELSAMDILGAHRAIARMGAHVLLPAVPNELFHELSIIEGQYNEKRRNAVKLQRQMTRLGKMVGTYVQKHVHGGLLARCSEILVLSQFPLGLAILDGAQAALSSLRPVYYRPLVPVTRALQAELRDVGSYYWELKRPRLLIVECLNPSDPIYAVSQAAWRYVEKEMTKAFEVVVREATSVGALSKLVDEHTPDVLLISAHGTRGPAYNLRSVRIGDDFYTGTEIERLPPLVLLSVCATAPRGAGDFNVSDLMLRQRAHAVLCCMVPVDVEHNARLFVRFLTNIHAARTGELALRTVADVWNFTSWSNAVMDILHSIGRTPSGADLDLERYRFEFMSSRSHGRLRVAHIYEDTIEVLLEMARERNEEEKLRSLIRNGYLPETQFYMLLGRPEKIVLRADEFRLFSQQQRSGPTSSGSSNDLKADAQTVSKQPGSES